VNRKEYMQEYRQKHREERKEYNKEWIRKNLEHYKKNRKEWYEKNKEYIQKQRRESNPEYYKNYTKNRYKRDLKFRLSRKIDSRIYKGLKKNEGGETIKKLLGYTLTDLKKHLQKTTPAGYTWNNYLEGRLQMDHIIPKSNFNFTNPEHVDFKRCWALGNLRLILAKENIKKKNKLYKPFQPALQI
jgi:5-methylcytosine-specific restriction endonuclease McrA